MAPKKNKKGSQTMSTFPWTIFFILLGAGVLCTLAVIPYSLALNPATLETLKTQLAAKAKANARPLDPTAVVLLSSLGQGLVLSALAAFVGLLAAGATGLDLPLLRGALSGQPVLERFLAFLPYSLGLGFAGGAALVLLDRYLFFPRLPAGLKAAAPRLSFWKSALACFYGGIFEEILLRLFVMGGLAWLLGLVWRAPNGLPATGAFWAANLLAALLFGAGHLPATLRIAPPTAWVLTRAFLLNGLVGLLCGWLFLTFGLEAAMLAHFIGDILIHLVAPALNPEVRRLRAQPAQPAQAAQ
jgi:hypothetical protein